MHLRWRTARGLSRNHRPLNDTPTRLLAGRVLLACGRLAPAPEAVQLLPNRRQLTCRGCLEHPPLPFAVDGRLQEIGWQRALRTTGVPRFPPRMHLTDDGVRTCCGTVIPDLTGGTDRWRYERLHGGELCEKCFTPRRIRRLIDEGMDLL
jgi:hypothetical protein